MKKYAKIALIIVATCSMSGATNRFFKAEAENLIIEQEELIEPITSEQGLQISAKAAFLMDYGSETAIYSLNEKKHLPIASMCKIMTLLLSFEALERGDLLIDEEVCIS